MPAVRCGRGAARRRRRPRSRARVGRRAPGLGGRRPVRAGPRAARPAAGLLDGGRRPPRRASRGDWRRSSTCDGATRSDLDAELAARRLGDGRAGGPARLPPPRDAADRRARPRGRRRSRTSSPRSPRSRRRVWRRPSAGRPPTSAWRHRPRQARRRRAQLLERRRPAVRARAATARGRAERAAADADPRCCPSPPPRASRSASIPTLRPGGRAGLLSRSLEAMLELLRAATRPCGSARRMIKARAGRRRPVARRRSSSTA